MKKYKLLLGVIIGALLIGSFGYIISLPTRNHYTGKEVFTTEKAYSEFKYVIGDEDVEIENIQVLSSEPPIVVEYEVSVPLDKTFAYGDEVGIYYPDTIMLTFIFAMLGGACGYGISSCIGGK